MDRIISIGIRYIEREYGHYAYSYFLDWIEFHVHVGASSIALGVILTQLREEDMDHPIDFLVES